MNEDIILENVQVGCHGDITGKVKSTKRDNGQTHYEQLLSEMQKHFTNDQMISMVSYMPQTGELCAGIRSNCWFRVKVVNMLSGRRTGYIVTCFFVDEGHEATIPVSGLKHLPAQFCSLPFQMKNIHLYGIQPFSMKTSPEDLHVYFGPKRLWDEAAVKFIDDNIKAATQVRCAVMESYAGDTLSVRMFLGTRQGGLRCLNEVLVNGNYAIGTVESSETHTVSPQTSETLTADIEKVFRRRLGSNKLTLENTLSDVEYSSGSLIPDDGGDSDEHVTDGRGISAVAHRSFQRTSPKTLTDMYERANLLKIDSVNGAGELNEYSHGVVNGVEPTGHSGGGGRGSVQSDRTSDRQRMRGVRGSYSSCDEHVQDRLEHRRQIILNKHYTETPEDTSLLSDAHGDKPRNPSPPKPKNLSPPKPRNPSPPKPQSPNLPNPQSSVKNGVPLFKGRGSPSYGRGALLTSELISKLKSPSCASSSSHISNESPPTGRGAILLSKLSCRSAAEISSLSVCEDDTFRDNSDSERIFGKTQSAHSLSDHIRSVSEIDSSTESEASALTRCERRRRAKLSGINSDIESDSNQSATMQSRIEAHANTARLTFSTSSGESKPTRTSSIESSKERTPFVISGNESSASGVSIVEASIRGQAEYKGVRLPKSSNMKGNSNRRFDCIEQSQAAASSSSSTHSPTMSLRTNDQTGSMTYDQTGSMTYDQTGSRTYDQTGSMTFDQTGSMTYDQTGSRTYDQNETRIPDQTGSRPYEKKGSRLQDLTGDRITDQTGSRLCDQTGSGASGDDGVAWKATSAQKHAASASDSSTSSNQRPSLKQILARTSSQLSETSPKITEALSKRTEASPNIICGAMPAERYENGSAHTTVAAEAKSRIIGEMVGKRMLTNLVQGSSRNLARPSSQPAYHEPGFDTLCYEVLVHGSRPPKPVYEIQNARFTEHVEMAFNAEGYHEPTLAQAFSWPAITRGRHVVTVSPPGGGKTLAYLCPLISALSDARVYSQVKGNGNGPFVIVLSFTWRRAERVYLEASKMVWNRHEMKVKLVYGGAQLEEDKACELLNGCEILVATPPSLTRILKAGYTDLRRLCHLVVDDADQTLFNFQHDISNLIKSYDIVIKNQMKHLGCPRQVLCFGAQWNASTSAFMHSNLNEPVLVITSPFEAAIYGQVKQVTHMCRKDARLKEVLGILENLPDDSSHPVIIFATDKTDIKMLYKTLKTCSRICLMVHEDMDTFEAARIAEQWPVPLLVCWDEHTAKLKITDATAVIHYDMPPSKTKFSNRLCCMRQYFHNFSKSEQCTIKPTSHIIITEDCRQQLKTLNDLLVRLECERPENLKLFMAGILEEREVDESREMCTQTLAFGVCRDVARCQFRHRIIPEVDTMAHSDWLPNDGELKVLVTHVQDASHFYVRVLEVRRDGSARFENLSLPYTSMQMDLSMWYSNLTHKNRFSPDVEDGSEYIGEICGYEENEIFYRIQIHNVKFNRENSYEIKVWVKFVDSGKMKMIPAYKLFVLPRHLQELPFQAVEVFVCKVRPMDKDLEWTSKANMYIHEALDGKELVGNVLLRLGYIVWLDPLLLRKYLPLTKAVSHQFYVHEELTRNGFADENKNHLQKLYKLCEGKINIPKALLKKTKMSRMLDTDVLPAPKLHHEVHMSSVDTPDLFFLQRSEKCEELESMMAEINEFVEHNDIYVDIAEVIKAGRYCLAQYTNYDQRWYRGQILEVADDHFKVFFADYGDSDLVPKDKIRKIPLDRFHELPLQAVECKLAGIRPVDEDWSETVGDVLWDFSHYVNADLRELTAIVKGKEPAEFAGRHRFIVELSTKSWSCDLNIAQELSWRRLATLIEDSDIEPLFPRPTRMRLKMYCSPFDKVPDLCGCLYWEQDESKAMKIMEEIHGIMSCSVNSLTDAMNSTAAQTASCLVKLLGRVRWDSVHKVLLHCILCLAQVGERSCDELINEGYIPSIVRCLEQNSNIIMQEQAADCIAKSSQISSRLKTYFRQQENVQVLYELLGSTDSDLVQGCVCRAFAVLCSGCERVYSYLMDKSICHKLVKCLLHTTEHEVSEGVLILIATLAEHDSGHEDLKKESLIEAIVKNLSKTDCNKCIQYSVQQCDYFSSTRRKHKTFLLEQQMVPILTRILQLELPSSAKQLCKDLLTSLVIKVPSEPLAGTAIRAEKDVAVCASRSGVAPEVRWSQNTFRVVLKVTVRSVCGSPHEVVQFTDNSVQFRATVDGLCYAFTYQLFDRIIIDKCTIEIGTQVVAISMKKLIKGKWNRLLHDKIKPSNLFVDFENWVDSSSDSEVCDDEQPFVLKKKQRSTKVFRTSGSKSRFELEEQDSGTNTSDSLENMEDRDDALYDNFL